VINSLPPRRTATSSAWTRAPASSAGQPARARRRTPRDLSSLEASDFRPRLRKDPRHAAFIAAQDAVTGKDVWKFYNVPARRTWLGELGQGLKTPTARPPGDCPALTIRSARPFTGVSRIPCPTLGWSATAAIRTALRVLRPPIYIATLRSHSTLKPQAQMVLPASARRRLDMDYTHERHAGSREIQSQSEVREMVQSRYPARRRARRSGDGGEGGGGFRNRPRHGQFLWPRLSLTTIRCFSSRTSTARRQGHHQLRSGQQEAGRRARDLLVQHPSFGPPLSIPTPIPCTCPTSIIVST